MHDETWKRLYEFPESNYEVSSLGRIRNHRYGKPLKVQYFTNGYQKITLSINGKPKYRSIHRLVAEAFLGPAPDLEVNHIDGNKSNNKLSNLEWVTPSDNKKHAYSLGLMKSYGHVRRRQIRLIETGEIFESVASTANHIGGKRPGVSNQLARRKTSYMGYTFEYVE